MAKIPKHNACFIDGVKLLHVDYVRRLKTFHILPGNLTQFLPQDRVTELGDLKKEDLLMATEQAVSVCIT